jgi:NAD(P)H-hydrate epimerase
MVIDADGLNNLARVKIDLSQHAGERVFTPHPGEFQRLAGQKFSLRREMEDFAVEFARRNRCVVLLKGQHSLVTDGIRSYLNGTGNEGMATAGAGDVLTGIIASMIGQKMECFDSTQVGCYLHGLAADLYAEQNLPASLIATDLIDFLPKAMARLAEQTT